MDPILELAKTNACKYRSPNRDTIYERDWKNQHVIFEIQKGKVMMNYRTPCNFEEEFNLEKRILVSQFLETYVLDETMSCKIPFDMNMHDFVDTRMNTDIYPHSILSMSVLDNDPINIPVPDFYAMKGYDGSIYEPDLLPFEHKVNQLFFIGVSTGNADPSLNKRIRLCQYGLQVPWMDAYISQVIQMKSSDLYTYDPYSNYYLHPHLPSKYQKMYRHLISVDGNTAAWDRVPWILASKSVLWKEESSHSCWYYPYLQPWKHYIPFTLENLGSTWFSYKDHPVLPDIVKNANQFVADFLMIEKHALYMKTFFQEVIERYDP